MLGLHAVPKERLAGEKGWRDRLQLTYFTHSDVLLRCAYAALHAVRAGHSSEQPDLTWKAA